MPREHTAGLVCTSMFMMKMHTRRATAADVVRQRYVTWPYCLSDVGEDCRVEGRLVGWLCYGPLA